ncbi:hypothetical protein PIB30_059582 [Stylosanthes scabra]|uniref:Uncharacterized protein n=1 Tax=Stylosanthes scabra TaxID=79078 RepID=A0ABU6TMQ3_9FABA|nr:hypothetical protein [Stylosanthes scabra]
MRSSNINRLTRTTHVFGARDFQKPSQQLRSFTHHRPPATTTVGFRHCLRPPTTNTTLLASLTLTFIDHQPPPPSAVNLPHHLVAASRPDLLIPSPSPSQQPSLRSPSSSSQQSQPVSSQLSQPSSTLHFRFPSISAFHVVFWVSKLLPIV